MKQKLNSIEATAMFQRGEEDGFNYFFNELHEALIYFCWRKVQDRFLAEDATYRSFIKIWERHDKFNHPAVIKSWLYKTALHDCLNILSRQTNVQRIERNYTIGISDKVESPCDENIIRSDVVSEVKKYLHPLPPECRRVIELYYFEELSTREISVILGVSINTVQTQKAIGEKIMKEVADTGCRNLGKRKSNEETWELYKKVAECPLKAGEAAIKFGLTVRAVYDMRYKYKKSIRGF